MLGLSEGEGLFIKLLKKKLNWLLTRGRKGMKLASTFLNDIDVEWLQKIA